jgi:mono/diheme cytochrome c family protein
MKRAIVLAAALCALSAGCRRTAARPPRAIAPPRPSAYELELGKQTFDWYCSGCHGAAGAGDGFNAFNLDPRPRDLSNAAFQKSKSDDDLRDVIRRGGSGVGLSSLMPPWGHTLNSRQVDAVVLYVRTMRH